MTNKIRGAAAPDNTTPQPGALAPNVARFAELDAAVSSTFKTHQAARLALQKAQAEAERATLAYDKAVTDRAEFLRDAARTPEQAAGE